MACMTSGDLIVPFHIPPLVPVKLTPSSSSCRESVASEKSFNVFLSGLGVQPRPGQAREGGGEGGGEGGKEKGLRDTSTDDLDHDSIERHSADCVLFFCIGYKAGLSVFKGVQARLLRLDMIVDTINDPIMTSNDDDNDDDEPRRNSEG